jgi:hypothetical protein
MSIQDWGDWQEAKKNNLPKPGMRVLTYGVFGRGKSYEQWMTSFATRLEDGTWQHEGERLDVTHWRFLPSPPDVATDHSQPGRLTIEQSPHAPPGTDYLFGVSGVRLNGQPIPSLVALRLEMGTQTFAIATFTVNVVPDDTIVAYLERCQFVADEEGR